MNGMGKMGVIEKTYTRAPQTQESQNQKHHQPIIAGPTATSNTKPTQPSRNSAERLTGHAPSPTLVPGFLDLAVAPPLAPTSPVDQATLLGVACIAAARPSGETRDQREFGTGLIFLLFVVIDPIMIAVISIPIADEDQGTIILVTAVEAYVPRDREGPIELLPGVSQLIPV